MFYYKIDAQKDILIEILDALYQLKIQSIIVEGGAKLLQSFIDNNHWDEARIITNTQLSIPNGLGAPILKEAELIDKKMILEDRISYYKKTIE
ncbi:MAG: dihydrofolate reductase family protein [Ferruginibacter sp.]